MSEPKNSPPFDIQKRTGVSAPQSFWNATGEKRARNCNGCGTEGWKGSLVPETVWGLRISLACDVHDWMYADGETLGDKEVADIIFLCNLLSIIRRAADKSFGGWCLKILRERRAMTYYQAVADSSTGLAAFNASRLL